jgi:hypothetical protein
MESLGTLIAPIVTDNIYWWSHRNIENYHVAATVLILPSSVSRRTSAHYSTVRTTKEIDGVVWARRHERERERESWLRPGPCLARVVYSILSSFKTRRERGYLTVCIQVEPRFVPSSREGAAMRDLTQGHGKWDRNTCFGINSSFGWASTQRFPDLFLVCS